MVWMSQEAVQRKGLWAAGEGGRGKMGGEGG